MGGDGKNCRPDWAAVSGLSSLIGAGGEINLFAALGAFMGFIKLVGKDFLGCIAFMTFAGK
jgi:hypothetical protein